MGDKITSSLKQNRTCNGYYIKSGLNNVPQSGYYSSNLGYDKNDWFVDEVVKL